MDYKSLDYGISKKFKNYNSVPLIFLTIFIGFFSIFWLNQLFSDHRQFHTVRRCCGFDCSITVGVKFKSTWRPLSFVTSNWFPCSTFVFFFLFLIFCIKQQKQQIHPNGWAAQHSGSVSATVSKACLLFFTVFLRPDFDFFISQNFHCIFRWKTSEWHSCFMPFLFHLPFILMTGYKK